MPSRSLIPQSFYNQTQTEDAARATMLKGPRGNAFDPGALAMEQRFTMPGAMTPGMGQPDGYYNAMGMGSPGQVTNRNARDRSRELIANSRQAYDNAVAAGLDMPARVNETPQDIVNEAINRPREDGPLAQTAYKFSDKPKIDGSRPFDRDVSTPFRAASNVNPMFNEPSAMQQSAALAKEQGMDRQEYLLLRRAQRNFRRESRGRRGSGEAAMEALKVMREGRGLGHNMVGAYDGNQRKKVIQAQRAEADRLASKPR